MLYSFLLCLVFIPVKYTYIDLYGPAYMPIEIFHQVDEAA